MGGGGGLHVPAEGWGSGTIVPGVSGGRAPGERRRTAATGAGWDARVGEVKGLSGGPRSHIDCEPRHQWR
jgi:hypothetical protein